MYTIHFTMDSGSQHVLSRSVYGTKGEAMDERDASVQLSLITEKLRYFTVDDGSILFTEHISTAKVIRNGA